MSYRRLRQAILLVLGLVLVLTAVSYSSLLQRGYVVIKFGALLVGATALLALCSFLVFQNRRWKELADPLFYLLAAELAVLGISIAFSGQPMVSLLGSMPRLMGTLTILCFLVGALAVVLGAGRRRENLLFLLRVLAATSIAVSLNAIYEWPTHPIFRPAGLVGNAEFLSNYLLFGSLGSLGLMLVERRTGWWIFATVAAAIIAVGMAVLKTRGAWLGYGAGIVAFLLVAKPWRQPEALIRQTLSRLLILVGATFGVACLAALWGFAKAIAPVGWHALLPFLPVLGMAFLPLPWLLPRVRVLRHALVAVIGLVVIVTGYAVTTQTAVLPYKVGSTLRVTQESARGIVREDTVSMLSKYWLTGCGIENFRVAFLEFKSERVARADPRVNYRNPHNMLLYEWTANGLLGMLVYVGLIVVGIWSLLLARRREEETGWGLLAAGLLATLVAYLVHNFFNYDVIPTGLMFYVLLAMATVLRRTAGVAPPETPGPEKEPAPEDPLRAATEPTRGPRKRRRARAKAAPTGRARRLANLEDERRRQETRWMLTSLIWGLGGAAVLFMILWGVPGIKEAFSFSITELKSVSREVPVKTDILPWILMLAWLGYWAVVFFCGGVFGAGRPEDPDAAEDAPLPQHAWFVITPLLLGCVSVGWWWASRQIQADYHMFRALAYSRAAGSSVIPGIQRSTSGIRALRRQEQMLRQQGRSDPRLQQRFEGQRRRLERQGQVLAPLLGKLLERAVYHGRKGAAAVDVLGYYHFQYSKVLHPFLKARGVLRGYNAVALESLRHARRSVYNNTNPESAWSHLSVVYLACGSLDPAASSPLRNAWLEHHQSELLQTLRTRNLSLAKWALAKSISHDKFYYDTHRMMALLHLQSGHIDEAVAEINRSLDITEGRHWIHSREGAVTVRRALVEGDEAAADKARRQMWRWLLRTRNFPGMPVQPLKWIALDERQQALATVARLLSKGKLREARQRLGALARGRGVKRVPAIELRFLRGVHATLEGDSGTAFTLLRNLQRPKHPQDIIDEVIQLVTAAVSVETYVNRMIEAAGMDRSQAQRVRQAFAQGVERAMSAPRLYLKIFGFVISDMVDNGELQQAKQAAQAAAQFAYLLYSRQRRDYFGPAFRRIYGQVVSAKEQVESAASKSGRLMRAQQMLGRRDFAAALRIIQGGLRKFGPKQPLAHFFMGAAYEGLRRKADARQAFERYLQQDPNGKYADKVRERLKSL